ncbi:MAG: tetratricopeptide repeat protein [Gammaproteobacteria bacterium]|nr:tetratricopeptide repeat protein [Gammaproteobacteria bacterium]MBU1732226.1 tetratricopeptide repeat protein [Gammaproteobacteria bacterium]MBU1893244.1 tetratricopeptide repeat protein [Gammaproteobacteria bacterium]
MLPTKKSKTGRNDPCPCGSGKKYKQCCQRPSPPPDQALACYNMGNAFLAQGRLDAAVEGFRAAIAYRPEYAEAHNNLGAALQAKGQLDNAIECFRKACKLQAGNPQAHNNLGAALLTQGKLSEAINSFLTALALKPDYAKALSNLGNARQELGLLPEAIESHRRALQLQPDFTEAHTNLLFALGTHNACTVAEYLEEAHLYGTGLMTRAMPFTHWATPAGQALRVGLVSGDLCAHPVGYFLESILAHLDPARIELVAYATNRHEDELTIRIKPHFSAWHNIAASSHETAARKIHSDGIQVLVDLAGHTAHNCLPIFAWKPAPVQVSWLGYFASTGVPGMDYLLADPVSAPEAHLTHFSEKIWHLPDSRLCFTPPTKVDELVPAPLPARLNGHVTFGSFQNLAKINDNVLTVWGRIFHALPQARLRVQNKQMGNETERAHLQQRLQKAGIGADRVTMHGPLERQAYLAAHAEVDIILDTFPYPGGTTTCEALWMGVPTLTLAGDRLLARQGASLLGCTGLEDWIAGDEEDYIARALAHASNIGKLAQLRSALRRKVLDSPLFDAPRFALQLEDALHGMWQQGKK